MFREDRPAFADGIAKVKPWCTNQRMNVDMFF